MLTDRLDRIKYTIKVLKYEGGLWTPDAYPLLKRFPDRYLLMVYKPEDLLSQSLFLVRYLDNRHVGIREFQGLGGGGLAHWTNQSYSLEQFFNSKLLCYLEVPRHLPNKKEIEDMLKNTPLIRREDLC